MKRHFSLLLVATALFCVPILGCSGMVGDDEVENQAEIINMTPRWTHPNGDFTIRGWADDPRGIDHVQIAVRGPCLGSVCGVDSRELLETHTVETDEEGMFSVESHMPEEEGLVSVTAVGGTGKAGVMFPIERDDPDDDHHVILEPSDLEALMDRCEGGCTTLDGNLEITHVQSLETLAPLSGLEEIEGRVRISDNPKLRSLTGLESLRHIDEGFYLGQNPSLESLESLGGLSSAYELKINENPRLTSLDGLGGLESLKRLQIDGNERLERLTAFDALTDLDGLKITENDALTALGSFPALQSVEQITIESNPALVALSGFEHVESTEHGVRVRMNPSLERIDGFTSLTSTASLTLEENEALVSLRGFEKLRTIGSSFTAVDNAALESFDELSALEEIGWDLELRNNPKLRSCEIDKLTERVDIGGELVVESNGGGC